VGDEEEKPRLDATEAAPGLLIGSAPLPWAAPPPELDVLVLLASEYQPDPAWFPGVEVWSVPLVDPGEGSGLDYAAIGAGVKVGRKVAKAVGAGKRVLVTCRSGLNRSAFVAAIALMTMGRGRLGADKAIEILRRSRGDDVLSNDVWEDVLERYFSGHGSG